MNHEPTPLEESFSVFDVMCGCALLTDDTPDQIIHAIMDLCDFPVPATVIDSMYVIIAAVRADPLKVAEAERQLKQELLP